MKTMRRAGLALALALVALCGSAASAGAQGADYRDWNQLDDALEGAVGLHYGKLGGHGLAVRLPLEWWLYAQLAGGIWHTDDNKQHNLGLELNYLLRQDRYLRLYVAGGLAYFYEREATGTEAGRDVFATHRDWNVGAGLGVEFLQGERWSWQIEADFVHEGRSDNIKVAPQLGVYYYW